MKLLIDSREKSRIGQAEKLCKDKGIVYDVRRLNSNDYIFFDGNKSVGFEFKEIRDFVSSISKYLLISKLISLSYINTICCSWVFSSVPRIYYYYFAT